MKPVKDVKVDGHSFNARNVASYKKADFIKNNAHQFEGKSDKDRDALLGKVHDECTAAVTEADAPAPAETSEPKA